ncbi:MAG: hypothetical protein KKE20_02395 [Nanoarchaeota archaeon]|nr:hypothetical protein [Nanoarchaeota archaeon]
MIIKVTPDKEKAKSMLKLIRSRKEFASSIDSMRFPTNAAESHYEIIKELAAAILLLEGLKAVGEYAHKEMIEWLSKYKEVEGWEIRLMNDLRIKRNKSSYEGKEIDISYMENKKDQIALIIEKLENLLVNKLD